MKTRQAAKIRAIRDALVKSGFLTLDDQANALGLSRSTAWTILTGYHKGSGLSAPTINRMMTAPQLPQPVREEIIEYIQERLAGSHGHSKAQVRKFVARLSVNVESAAFRIRSSRHTEESAA